MDAKKPAGEPETLLQYGQMCRALIGEIPPFNCNDGETVPITVDGVTPSDYSQVTTCDRPAMLPYADDTFGQCTPFSKILDLSYDHVQISAFCRREYLRESQSPFYDEVDIILHSVATGDTCWFHAESPDGDSQGFNASRVPPPYEKTPPSGHVSAEDFWWTPTDTASKQCVSCHDADPFMYSPYIGQVWHKVPTDPWGFYNNRIGSAFNDWPIPKSITTRDNTCNGCHRIGNLGSCKLGIIASAAGRIPIAGANALGNSYPLNHWMPADNFHSEAFWSEIYDQSVDELLACCSDPDRAGCTLTPLEGR
ncbi:MAG TPA: hypothetical protein VIC26_13370 [Marinagarivorans sp.]